MSRDKQTEIEELAKAICGLGRDCHGCTASMSYICKAKKYAERAVDKGYAKASDVAREIFEEIEEVINKPFIVGFNLLAPLKQALGEYDNGIRRDLLYYIAELKKKYTESEKDNG